ncbi:MAG: amidohydrolase [Verrucomicrobia bacterium]|nr:amidohydrolase [Verrucomicrobiota bacterium]
MVRISSKITSQHSIQTEGNKENKNSVAFVSFCEANARSAANSPAPVAGLLLKDNVRRSLAVTLCLWLAVVGSSVQGAEPPADLAVINAKVVTVDSRFSIAEAAAIRDGRFVAVGANAEVKKLVGDRTRVIDAHGKTVIPGLIESHVHAIGVARGEVVQPFIQLSSIAEIQQWVREQVRTLPEPDWIQIPRIDLTRLREGRLPTRAELDAAAPERPVVFNWQYASRQIQVLNTAALRAAKITRDTIEPVGGNTKILKDASGELTGVLENPGGSTAKFRQTRPIPDQAFLTALKQVHRSYNRIGITSVFERNSNAEGYRAYEKLKAAGELTVRATVTIGYGSRNTLEEAEKFIQGLPFRFGDGDDWVRVGPLKIAVDGGILYGTAYMREPYGPKANEFYGFTDPSHRGTVNHTPERIENMMRAAFRAGWQMCSHVTGDAGVDRVLEALDRVNRDFPVKDRRYTLIHAYFPNPSAVRRAAELGVCVDTQPDWFYKDGDALAKALGEDRLKSFIGLADWVNGSVKTAINSDHMHGLDPNKSLNPFNPFLAMYVAVTRRMESGRVVGPEQRVSREQALRMATIDAAYLGFDEKRKGSIEVGKLGDLAMLSDDLLTCDPDRIKDIQALLTVVGGRIVHEAASR